MKKLLSSLLVVLALAACAGPDRLLSGAAGTAVAAPVYSVSGRNGVEGRILGSLGPRFSKLEIGMRRAEVETLIGHPDRIGAQASGTGWLPFYTGDGFSTESYYQGEGRLIFNSDSQLILIEAGELAR